MNVVFVCFACGKEKLASQRSAGRQSYCGERVCQRSRKAAWQRQSLSRDRDHCANQRLSQEAWRREHANYWAEYRRRRPDIAERNRRLQARRDRKRRHQAADSPVLAKMDALIPKPPEFYASGEYWLVPVLAKMDALRVKILVVSDS